MWIVHQGRVHIFHNVACTQVHRNDCDVCACVCVCDDWDGESGCK
jgi:hypothetical protein